MSAENLIVHADDYRGKPINSRQGRDFVPFDRLGFTVIQPVPFLHGKKWNEIALGYIHALRPSWVRVVNGGTQMDAQDWRVTVDLEDDNETIRQITQEVQVGLPDGITHGHALNCAARRNRQ